MLGLFDILLLVHSLKIKNSFTRETNFFQDKDEHLELMDGVLVDLLNAKWNTFVKSRYWFQLKKSILLFLNCWKYCLFNNTLSKIFRFYRQFFLFCFYFILSLISFTLRPGPFLKENQGSETTSSPILNATDHSTTVLIDSWGASQLSSIITKNLAEHLLFSMNSSLNATPSSVERVTLKITSDITATLKDVLRSWRYDSSFGATESATLGSDNNTRFNSNQNSTTPNYFSDTTSSEEELNVTKLCTGDGCDGDDDDW